ncbi:MAG: GLPGLI family protein [Muribaculaceae bacterium]|nr:GLPGLI family protein [Muribaculaceae bacterium]
MKHFLIYITLIIFAFSAQAQKISLGIEYDNKKGIKISKIMVPDTAKWSIVYAHVSKDEILNKEKTDFEMLSIGKRFRWYGGYGNYQIDSLYRDNPGRFAEMTFGEFISLKQEYESILPQMITDTRDSVINYYCQILIDSFEYTEPIPKFDWTLEEESTEIMGYTCYKATTNWRGRNWIAWYCDIPESAGPWKFNGLPGLILRIEDSEHIHLFDAIETKNDPYPLGYSKKSYLKTTREKFNAAFKDYKENAGQKFLDSGLIARQGENEYLKKRRLFFAPIELK